MITILNDPAGLMLQALRELYPGTEAVIQYDASLDSSSQEWSNIIFGYATAPLVNINPKLSIDSIPNVLSHELAHAVMGDNTNHGGKFKRVVNNLHDRFEQLKTEQYRIYGNWH